MEQVGEITPQMDEFREHLSTLPMRVRESAVPRTLCHPQSQEIDLIPASHFVLLMF